MGGASILIVEDELAIAEPLGEMLQDEGYAVTLAGNGEAALEVLARGPAPDVILLDLMMPRMDGHEFRARQLAQPALAEIPTVVLSAMPGGAERARLRATDWLRKPVQLGVLLDSVARCCARVAHDHRVCFHEGDDRLIRVVAPFLGEALERRGAAVAIVTAPHAARLRDALATAGCDVAALEKARRLVIGDAPGKLASLLGADGALDEGRVRPVAAAVVDRTLDAASGGPVALYGEMVDLLWARGDAAGALRLERLWNGVARARRFSLLCSYHASAAAADGPALAEIRAEHAGVV